MNRLGLRCAPVDGRHDLAWLAALAGSLNEIHEFLLRAHAVARLAPVQPAGETVLELRTRSSKPDTLALMALLFAQGPGPAAWPGYVRRAWFGEGDEPARARRAHDWIRRHAVVQPLDTGAPPAKRKKKGRRSTDLPPGVHRAPPL